jgi:glucose/arabinose dehydrogenase
MGLANVAAVAVDDDDRLWAATASFADDGSDAVYLVPAAAVSAPCGACDPTTEDAAAVVSVLPDGTDLRVVASRIRAPVGLAFLPSSDDLFVTMNQRDDLGEATPGDWLAVVRDGQDWGFPGCYGQGGTVCHGTPAPVAELDSMPPSAGWRS